MADFEEKRIVDLSHVIEDGMTTYKGLPGPVICDFWERESTAANYDDGSTFQIGRIGMIANTGTYVDSPFHRYADGADLADLPLPSLAELPGIVIRQPWENGIEVGKAAFDGLDITGKAVLVHTGWDRHWRTERYLSDNPSSQERQPTGSSRTALLWSASTASTSTIREGGRVLSIPSCSPPRSRSASI